MKACSAGPDNDGNWTRSDPATQQFLVKEKGPVLALAPMTGQAAGAQPDDRNLVEVVLRATRGRDGLRYRAGRAGRTCPASARMRSAPCPP